MKTRKTLALMGVRFLEGEGDAVETAEAPEAPEAGEAASTEETISAAETAITGVLQGQIDALKATVATLTAALNQAQADNLELLTGQASGEPEPEPADDPDDLDDLDAAFI